MTCLLVSFVAGGIVSSGAYATYHLQALLLPAGVIFRRNLHLKSYSSQVGTSTWLTGRNLSS